jgi:hypothetical protein
MLFLMPTGRLATLSNPHADIAVEPYEFTYVDAKGGAVSLRDPLTISKIQRVVPAVTSPGQYLN